MDYFSGYIGTYTQGATGRGQGIYAFKLDTESGTVKDLRVAALCVNPSYLALAPSKKYLYAVHETDTFDGKPGGSVSAFAIKAETGGLTFLNRKSSKGKSPCHIAVNQEATHGVVANYTGGTLGVFPLEPAGALGEAVQIIPLHGSGPHKDRQEGPRAHFFMFDPNNAYGCACDLGSDRVMIYSFNKYEAAPLSPLPAPGFSSKPGAGPRHGVFHPNGNYGYVVNELDSTVDVLRYDGRGGFEKTQSLSTLPQGTTVSNTAAAIKIGPDGRFLYVSNRGHDSIAVYKVSDRGGLEFLQTLPSGGKIPRDFTLDPTGTFLLACHQDSDNLVVFRIDRASGLFRKVREYEVPSGVCVILA
ncbi:MAG: lactonase family protein [Treponema sp.]|jgi:6-phosphogluconolactonase|nr:lactonase family protein [Treponema sp.]